MQQFVSNAQANKIRWSDKTEFIIHIKVRKPNTNIASSFARTQFIDLKQCVLRIAESLVEEKSKANHANVFSKSSMKTLNEFAQFIHS